MENEKLKYTIYCRKSSETEDRQVLSIESQKKELKELSIKSNLDIIDTLWESKSAYDIGREEFEKMITLIKSGKSNAILTWHLTRLARNPVDGGLIIYLMDKGFIKEITTHDGTFKNSTNDKFLMQIHFAMAKKSSDDTSDFVKRDFQTKISKGEQPNHIPPGYLNIDRNGKISGKQYLLEKQIELEKLGRKLKRVEIDPFNGPIVKELFELASKNIYTEEEVLEMSYEMGLRGSLYGKKITKSTLQRMLTNPFYYGAVKNNGKIIDPSETPEETRHNALISKELFFRVQEVLGSNQKCISKKNYYIYTNYIKCGVCGSNISALVSKGHTYYRCMKCKGLAYTEEENIEKQLENLVSHISIDEDFLNLAINEVNNENEKEINQRDEKMRKEKILLTNCQSQLDNLIRLKISPQNTNGELLNDDEFIKQKNAITKDKGFIEDRIKEIETNNIKWFDDCTNYFDFITKLHRRFKNMSPETKKEVFQFICTNPIITNQILNIDVKNPDNFIIQYNFENQSIITKYNSENKTKIEANELQLSNWLREWDSDPRPIDYTYL